MIQKLVENRNSATPRGATYKLPPLRLTLLVRGLNVMIIAAV